MQYHIPTRAITFGYPLSASDLVLAAIQDYFRDERYTASEIRYYGQMRALPMTRQVQMFQPEEMYPTGRNRVSIVSEYSKADQEYPRIVIHTVSTVNSETGFAQHHQYTGTGKNRKKYKTGMDILTIRYLILGSSVNQVKLIVDHLRNGLRTVIREQLAAVSVDVGNTNSFGPTTSRKDDWPSGGKEERHMVSFDQEFIVRWAKYIEEPSEYLFRYGSSTYSVFYKTPDLPFGTEYESGTDDYDADFSASSKSLSTVSRWAGSWENVTGDTKDTIWDYFYDSMTTGWLITFPPEDFGLYPGPTG